ncbi:MAG: peroxiredoxin family protein [Flavobacteriales bacterium]|nr:peroxiredoxin family protein [Flavobacteriales bacterium]
MLKYIHPFTSLGLLLLLAAPPFFMLDHPQMGIVLLLLAYGSTAMEFKKYTSDYQFAMLLLSACALGIAIDLRHQAWPLVTTSLLLAAMATIARQKYMQRFTYINLLWLDSGTALLSAGIFLFAIVGDPFVWDLWLPPLLPILGAIGLTASYVQDGMHIRRSVQGGYKVQVGREAPDLELPDADGKIVRLSDFRGKHPVLLIFVRGDWCPGCHMMLRTYERNRHAFLEKGVHVLGIGPDDISVNKDMVERIGVRFGMLSDVDQSVSARYGVVYNNPALEIGVDYTKGIPLPASFLVDVDGVVRYVSRPDRVGEYLRPELIFGALERLPVAQPAWT